eukprot:12715080-Heterocapsa_arctica.AAC.1
MEGNDEQDAAMGDNQHANEPGPAQEMGHASQHSTNRYWQGGMEKTAQEPQLDRQEQNNKNKSQDTKWKYRKKCMDEHSDTEEIHKNMTAEII